MLKNKCILWGSLCLTLVFLAGCTPTMEGLLKLDLGQYSEAIPPLQTAVNTNPDNTEIRNKLGFAYLKTGRLDEAITEFETVLKSEPGDSYAILYLGMAYLNKERFADAIAVWKTYRDEEKPFVESEIKRLLTLLQISVSQRTAKKALAEEEKLQAIAPDMNTVAVCYFENLSPDESLRGFQKGLAAMITTDLAKVQSLKVIERLRLQALLAEMKLGQTGIVNPETAPRVGRLLGAEHLITGNLSMGSIQVTTSLASTSNESVKGTATITVPREKFFELPSLVIRDTAKIMGVELTPDEIAAIGIPHTKSYKALIYFGQALDAMDAGRWEEAKDLFAKALAEDPKFDMARDANDSSPGEGSPGIGQLATMSPSTVASAVSASVSSAEDSQSSSDMGAAEGGGGGGDAKSRDEYECGSGYGYGHE